jgi:hypothetical protein
MRYKSLVMASILLTVAAYAKEPKAYQSGALVQMYAVSCGAGNTEELLCQEYVLQAEKVIYRVRPMDSKHPVLLPVGEQAQFRFEKDKMIVRVEYIDTKEREYVVVSMTPRSESTADASAVRLNHLQ